MQLYDNPFSPFAFKVRAALYEEGADFEKREIRRHDQREQLLRLNPRGEVPALVDDDAVICDSKVICAYLEEKLPEPRSCPPTRAPGRAPARWSSSPMATSTPA